MGGYLLDQAFVLFIALYKVILGIVWSNVVINVSFNRISKGKIEMELHVTRILVLRNVYVNFRSKREGFVI